MQTKTLFSLCVAAAIARPVSANQISQWTFDSSSGSATSMDANATASDFTLSSGAVSFVAGNPSSGKAISGTSWTGGDGAKWWQFTITANAGYELDLLSLTFDDLKSATGPTGWSVTINGVAAVSNQGTHGSFSANMVDLSAAAFQGLDSAVVKIFGFGASSGSGTWRVDNVTLNGAIAAPATTVPDGGTSALLLSIPLAGLFVSCRRARHCKVSF